MCVLVARSCPTFCNPMACSQPGFSVHGILLARKLEWVTISFSRGSSQLRNQTQVSCTVGRSFTVWATREAQASIRSLNQNTWASEVHWCLWHLMQGSLWKQGRGPDLGLEAAAAPGGSPWVNLPNRQCSKLKKESKVLITGQQGCPVSLQSREPSSLGCVQPSAHW